MRNLTSTIFAFLSVGAVALGSGCAAQGEDATIADSLSSQDKIELKAVPVKIDEEIKKASADADKTDATKKDDATVRPAAPAPTDPVEACMDKYVASQEAGIAEKCEQWRGILKQNSTYEWRKENGLAEDDAFAKYLDNERETCVIDLTNITIEEAKTICTAKEPVAPTCEEKAYGECKAGVIEKALQGAEIACSPYVKESPEKYKICVAETSAQYQKELFAVVDCAADAKLRCSADPVREVKPVALPTK